MIRNFKLIIEYDGTRFFGWQRQKDKISVQETIENALSTILNQQVKISGSGRTDAGVHAIGQVASFKADTTLCAPVIKHALNRFIKLPIVICALHAVTPDFHAQYSAVSKEYHYHILNADEPAALFRDFIWYIHKPLDLEQMKQAAAHLVGKHDFASFENTGSPRSSTVRTVFFCDFQKISSDRICFKICADGFLKYMVRNIVGTLVMVGKKKISPDQVKDILHAKDRTCAGPTAPPQGLFLKKVNY